MTWARAGAGSRSREHAGPGSGAWGGGRIQRNHILGTLRLGWSLASDVVESVKLVPASHSSFEPRQEPSWTTSRLCKWIEGGLEQSSWAARELRRPAAKLPRLEFEGCGSIKYIKSIKSIKSLFCSHVGYPKSKWKRQYLLHTHTGLLYNGLP